FPQRLAAFGLQHESAARLRCRPGVGGGPPPQTEPVRATRGQGNAEANTNPLQRCIGGESPVRDRPGRSAAGGRAARLAGTVGLPAEEQAEVFELFYRAAPARAAGLGVGLAVVKLLVEQSGGSLTVDSGEGQGTTFVAVLPRYDVDDFLI